MNDESETSPNEPSAELPHSAPALPEPTIVNMPLYRPGSRVSYRGQEYTVGHIIISRSILKVYLQELGDSVDSEKLQLPPTRLVLQRA